MKKISTEIYFDMMDGRKVFMKIVHGNNEKFWFVKEAGSKHYKPASKQDAQFFSLKMDNDSEKNL